MSQPGPAASRVGQHLVSLRRRAGMSQVEAGRLIAAHLGATPWSRQAVSAAEKGRRNWTADDMMALAAAFGVTAGSLFDDVPECAKCHGTPPEGFTCNACGAATPRL